MRNGSRLAAALVLALAALDVAAQTPASETAALRRQVERRFDLLPLRGGVALVPKTPRGSIRSIEITDGTIAIDGTPATGAELRERLGSDADLVIRLSYLDAETRRALAAPARPAESAPPATTVPPGLPAAPPASPETPSAPLPPPPARTRRSDDRIRIAGSVNVDADETVRDVVVIGGTARIMGEVENDVVVIGGSIFLGPQAEVGRDVAVIGGTVHRDPGARIGGKVSEIGPGIGLRGWRFGHGVPVGPLFLWGSMWGGLFALMSTLTRLAILSILASLVLLLGREYIERVAARAAAEPIKAGIVGFLAQLLFLPLLVVTIIVLVVTIIGIPLLVLIPFALLGVALVFLVGFTAVAHLVGQLVSTRLGSGQPNPYLTAIVGIVVVMSPVIIGRIIGLGDGLVFPLTAALVFVGFFVEYLAWTVGFGAVALSRFVRQT